MKNFNGIEPHKAKAHLYTNLAYCLCEVAHSFLLDADSNLNMVNLCVCKDEKRKWRDLHRSAQHLKGQTRIIARMLYDIDDSDQALDDSDWLADLILLIADRVGDDPLKAEKLRNFIEEGFPSEMGMYDKLRIKKKNSN